MLNSKCSLFQAGHAELGARLKAGKTELRIHVDQALCRVTAGLSGGRVYPSTTSLLPAPDNRPGCDRSGPGRFTGPRLPHRLYRRVLREPCGCRIHPRGKVGKRSERHRYRILRPFPPGDSLQRSLSGNPSHCSVISSGSTSAVIDDSVESQFMAPPLITRKRPFRSQLAID